MRKGDFISFIQQPGAINENNINDIQNIVSEFPYFQSAQILLCKAFYQSENINFENQLQKTAAYSADRKQLHHIIFTTDSTQVISPIEDIEAVEVDFSTPIKETKTKVFQEKTHAAEVDSTQADKSEVNTDEVTSRKELDFIERQILTEAINSSVLMEIGQKKEENGKFPAKEIEDKLGETAFHINKSEKVEIQQFDDDKNHSFSDWIHHFRKKEDTLSDKFEEKADQLEGSIPAKKEKKKKQNFYSASKMAKLSVQEDGDLVTETLAKIYVAQEKFEKAISAYEKLQLKYPEKKVYFAARINALKNQLKP